MIKSLFFLDHVFNAKVITCKAEKETPTNKFIKNNINLHDKVIIE